MERMACRLGRHKHGAVSLIGERHYSECIHCGVPMMRRRGGWVPLKPGEEPELAYLQPPPLPELPGGWSDEPWPDRPAGGPPPLLPDVDTLDFEPPPPPPVVPQRPMLLDDVVEGAREPEPEPEEAPPIEAVAPPAEIVLEAAAPPEPEPEPEPECEPEPEPEAEPEAEPAPQPKPEPEAEPELEPEFELEPEPEPEAEPEPEPEPEPVVAPKPQPQPVPEWLKPREADTPPPSPPFRPSHTDWARISAPPPPPPEPTLPPGRTEAETAAVAVISLHGDKAAAYVRMRIALSRLSKDADTTAYWEAVGRALSREG